AAETYLGKGLTKLTADMDKKWRSAVIGSWRERYKYAQQSQRSLSELEKKAECGPLTLDEAWQRACWTEEFQSSEAALPLYEQVLRMKGDHADALFSVGRIMLTQEKSEGADFIKRAMELNRDYAMPGCQLVCGFLLRKGKREEAKQFYEQAVGAPPQAV
ncbi:MAG TPA: hypothetical protein VNO14_09660, partial [Blastocatellia bacterium]|nr:hypothetical protein [Blastocatellia bacterium]